MKKLLILVPLFIAGVCISAQNLYVQPIGGEQISFTIAERPTITFDNRIMTIENRTFNLVDVQNLSFVAVVPVEPPPSNIVGEHVGSSLQVFPNPVTDKLHIVNEWQSGDVIELFDMHGRRVFSQPVETGHAPSLQGDTIIIDMSAFPAGNYILRVGNQSFQIVKR